ncbi:hypothetical protein F5X68DRAFT_231086 [Plectosphaerella plurivora]|uniref:Uncharacterized protein n=1 Tax=Plectosphaerella plurivora TaxID=936078 RepID=A0A9P8VBZ0_9PEZI|nr:hypothetical protein F5X68DRAFT_231086 [Plectosphaerella plurivora]
MYASVIKSTLIAIAFVGAATASPASYPDKCGDMVCPSDKPLCCSVPFNGGVGLECLAKCPPMQGFPTTMATVVATAPAGQATPPIFGPKCGDSFFCKPGQVCCTLYTCADTPEECPKGIFRGVLCLSARRDKADRGQVFDASSHIVILDRLLFSVATPPFSNHHLHPLKHARQHMPPASLDDDRHVVTDSGLVHKTPITFTDPSEPFTPKPLIAELLRTRYCVPDSIFLVEDVALTSLPRSSRWRVVRLLLGDGELCIQALLQPDMHPFIDAGTVTEGCYVRLGAFSIQHRDIEGDGLGGPKQMIYLVVEDMVPVGWRTIASNTETLEEQAALQDNPEDAAFLEDIPEEVNEDEIDLIPSSQIEFDDWIDQARQQESYTRTPTKSQRHRHPQPDFDNDDDYDIDADDFEDMLVSPSKTVRRREEAAEVAAISYANHPPVALPRDWAHPSIPLKLTTLRSIPHLPYKQNWSINALVVISSLDDVQPCPVPPFSMRTARVADPSTDKRILLTVFLDPDGFAPRVGSVVLLVGVKNHLFEGGSLKKYVSDRPTRPDERWWYEEPREFAWCDVEGMQRWWETEGKMAGDEP